MLIHGYFSSKIGAILDTLKYSPMLTGATKNRNTVLTSMIIMAVLIVGGFFVFAEPDGTEENQVRPAAELDIATIAEVAPVELPESVHVPILVYHHVRPTPAGLSASDRAYTVTPAALESHLRYLSEQGFTGVLLTDIRDTLLLGKPLPEQPVAITFDDGRENQYTNAVPLLEKYGFVATFSPFTNAIGRPGYVTWEQLMEMRDAGHDIGSHAVYHPYMTRLSEDEMRREAGESRAVLQEKLGMEIAVFSHPFGLFDEQTNAVLTETGYTVARGLEHTAEHTSEDLMSLGSYITIESLSYLKSIVD